MVACRIFRKGFLEDTILELRSEGCLGDPGGKGVWKVMKGLVVNVPYRGNTMAKESVARRCKDW